MKKQLQAPTRNHNHPYPIQRKEPNMKATLRNLLTLTAALAIASAAAQNPHNFNETPDLYTDGNLEVTSAVRQFNETPNLFIDGNLEVTSAVQQFAETPDLYTDGNIEVTSAHRVFAETPGSPHRWRHRRRQCPPSLRRDPRSVHRRESGYHQRPPSVRGNPGPVHRWQPRSHQCHPAVRRDARSLHRREPRGHLHLPAGRRRARFRAAALADRCPASQASRILRKPASGGCVTSARGPRTKTLPFRGRCPSQNVPLATAWRHPRRGRSCRPERW